MTWPEESRGERDAPLPTGKRSLSDRDAPLQSEPTGQHLYLIFDDWPWGYSIRKLKLPPPRCPHQRGLRLLEHRLLRRLEQCEPEQKRLPPPCICLEAKRRMSTFFASVGTNIFAAHRRYDVCNALMPERTMPVVDVSSMSVSFGPVLEHSVQPIFITVGDKVFSLDKSSFKMLSTQHWPPHQRWWWCDLPEPPLSSIDCTSVVVGSDESTIFASTDCATFAFDIANSEWKQSSNCSLPFAGPANYVHALDIFVGLSKAPDTYGYLCFCSKLGGDENVRLSKENLISIKGPVESLGATLLYLGGSEPGFCLVECIAQDKSGDMWLEKLNELGNCVDEGDGASGSMEKCEDIDELNKFFEDGSVHCRYLYRLTTFSLSFDDNGDLTTGETCVVQCYKVPKGVSEFINLVNPVAFWL